MLVQGETQKLHISGSFSTSYSEKKEILTLQNQIGLDNYVICVSISYLLCEFGFLYNSEHHMSLKNNISFNIGRIAPKKENRTQ